MEAAIGTLEKQYLSPEFRARSRAAQTKLAPRCCILPSPQSTVGTDSHAQGQNTDEAESVLLPLGSLAGADFRRASTTIDSGGQLLGYEPSTCESERD